MHRIEGANVDTSSGVNLYKTTAPLTVITPEQINSIQEELMYVVEQSGLPILGQANDTRDQIWNAIRRIAQNWDYIVDSQSTFVSLFTRTAANTYVINSDYSSVYFKIISGGYSFANVLSGGDTWGDIYTNNCTHLEFENGAYIDMVNLRGYLEVDTSGCYLKNVDVRGAGAVAAAISSSFLLNNTFVTFDNCKTSSRLSNTTFSGFKGSSTDLHNFTSKYNNCSVFTINGSSTIRGFSDCQNLENSTAYDINSTAGVAYGYYQCVNLSSFYAYDIKAGINNNARAIYNSTNITNGVIWKIDTTGTGDVYGIQLCNNISNINIIDLDSAGAVYGIHSSSNISACKIEDLDSSGDSVYGIHSSNQISSCEITDLLAFDNFNVYGIHSSSNISACKINQLDTSSIGDAVGIHSSNQVSSCEIQDLDAADLVYGIFDTDQIAACKIEDLDSSGDIVRGMSTCNNISSSYVFDLLSPVDTNVYGVDVCNNIASTKVDQIDTSGTGIAHGINDSDRVAACSAHDVDGAAAVYGFRDTDYISACLATDIETTGTAVAYGFRSPNAISACASTLIDSNSGSATAFSVPVNVSACWTNQIESASGNAQGFQNAAQISASRGDGITAAGGTAEGFQGCAYGSSLYTTEAVNSGNNFIDTADGGAVIATDFSCNDNWT